MNKILSIMGMVMLLALTSCGTVSVSSDYDRNANFAQYRTFAFHDKGLKDLKMNDLDKRRVVGAIQQNLENKGFQVTSTESNADIIINISAKTENHVDVTPWYTPWWGPWGMNGYWYSPRVVNYKDGTLILDFVDAKNNILVWQGVGSGLNLYRITDKAERIPKAVEEILSKYPPKK